VLRNEFSSSALNWLSELISCRNGILVDLALGKFRELGDGPLFLFEAVMKKLLVITQFELIGKGRGSAVRS